MNGFPSILGYRIPYHGTATYPPQLVISDAGIDEDVDDVYYNVDQDESCSHQKNRGLETV